jgi:hypothetical protein
MRLVEVWQGLRLSIIVTPRQIRKATRKTMNARPMGLPAMKLNIAALGNCEASESTQTAGIPPSVPAYAAARLRPRALAW